MRIAIAGKGGTGKTTIAGTLARALARERFEWVEGSHLYPMEHPDETAATVLRILHNMA